MLSNVFLIISFSTNTVPDRDGVTEYHDKCDYPSSFFFFTHTAFFFEDSPSFSEYLRQNFCFVFVVIVLNFRYVVKIIVRLSFKLISFT